MGLKIYLASSWRNRAHSKVLELLRGDGHEVYDFKRDGNGFSWKEIDSDWQAWTKTQFRDALAREPAVRGFRADMGALSSASVCVLVHPCGNDAHLELGWAAGRGYKTALLYPEPEIVEAEHDRHQEFTPGLMYKMVDEIAIGTSELRAWLSGLLELRERALRLAICRLTKGVPDAGVTAEEVAREVNAEGLFDMSAANLRVYELRVYEEIANLRRRFGGR